MRALLALALLAGCKREAETNPAAAVQMPAPGPMEMARSTALKWTVPEGWLEEPVASPMRRAQYRLPRAEGDAVDGECLVHYFGPGQGGMVEANVNRWLGQFEQPDGRATADVAKVEKRSVSGVPVTIVETTGTYKPSSMMGSVPLRGSRAAPAGEPPQEPQPGWALVGAIAETGAGPWFFKVSGPEKTIQRWRPAFERLVDSLQPQAHP